MNDDYHLKALFTFFVLLKMSAVASVSDSISAARSVINTVIGIYAKNLPSIPGKKIIGKNATSVVIVPLISGLLRSLTANIAAFFLL